jgi:D-alanyl-D-alanine carboxypeptidase
MKKRDFLAALVAGGGISFLSSRLYDQYKNDRLDLPDLTRLDTLASSSESPSRINGNPLQAEEQVLVVAPENDLQEGFKHTERQVDVAEIEQMEHEDVDFYLQKIRNFGGDFAGDIYLSEINQLLLAPTIERLERVQRFIGHGNFNLIGFDEMIYFARNYEEIGEFDPAELAFMEEIFYNDATNYGFFGEKVNPELTHRISQVDVEKIDGSGHYLLKGDSLNQYNLIHKDVGSNLLLTSGIRNVVKQMHLFLAKTRQSNGNLSKASRSLAPPGYSFHGVGDFDVGKIGLGEANFTANFSNTEEFRRLITLGYVDIRYTDTNRYGVRYEPWHIKII